MDIAQKIEKPTLLLNKARVLRNIDRMIAKAARNGVWLRPHFKTHQSAEIGEWFRERGVTAITVSSVDMAVYFADRGWNDITIAFPVNLRQMRSIDVLAQEVNLNLLVESVESVRRLSKGLESSARLWIKIDSGYGRTGIPWYETEAIVGVARAITQAPGLHLAGILTHAGQTYRATSRAEAVASFEESVSRMNGVRDALQARGLDVAISVGDTPGCSSVDTLAGVDEIRPGNFVFFDLTQLQIGACQEDDIAVAVACPVVAKHAGRRQIVIYGGAVHLSKEFLLDPAGSPYFGRIALLDGHDWTPVFPASYVRGLSQEHGVVQAGDELFEQVDIGDLLLVIPVHSCLTANLLRRYVTLEGNVIEMATLV
jgi:D-serine deaminase-like pyridoxal phosphate-dependent protein